MKKSILLIALVVFSLTLINAQENKVLSIKETAKVMLKQKLITKNESYKIDSINSVLIQERAELQKQKGVITEDELKQEYGRVSQKFTNTLKEIIGVERFVEWQNIRYSKK